MNDYPTDREVMDIWLNMQGNDLCEFAQLVIDKYEQNKFKIWEEHYEQSKRLAS